MALQETEIQIIVDTLSSKLKAADKATSKKEEKDVYGNAEWGELYKKATKHAEEIEVHSCGKFPDKLIGENFPGETNEEKTYRKKSFQPVTKPYWKKAMRTVTRVWADQNYSIDWIDEEAKKYFLEQFPLSDSVIQLFKTIVTANKIVEPNGVLAVDFDLPVRQNANGELVIDQAEALEPFGNVYECEDVLMFESGEFALLMSEEKSVVEYGGSRKAIGYVAYLYDDSAIYRIVQIGKKVDFEFQADVYYEHNLGYVPAWKLKGTPEEVIADEVFYESYFAPALPHLNEAVIIHSTNKSVRNKVSYPTRAYYEQSCSGQDCNDGWVYRDGNEKSKCSTCGGTGKLKFSPFRDYVHEAPNATNDAASASFPGFAYVSPDGTIIKDNEEVIDKYLETAFLFLNIEVNAGNQKGLNDPTATKSKIDRDEQYISMLDISNELFHLLQQFLNAAYKLRFLKDSPIVVKAPTNFDLISTEELSARLGEAKKAGLSDLAVTEMTLQLFEQDFPQATARKAEIAAYSDVLFVKDTTDIAILMSNKFVQPWQVLLHINFERYINEMIQADKVFMELSLPEIDKKLVDRAKVDEATMNAGGNSAEELLKKIAGGGAPTPTA